MSGETTTTISRERLTMAQAVRAHVRPGTCVYVGNFGAQLFSVGHEMIRQGCHDVDAVIASGGLLMDQLLGAGVLRSATYGHCWSPVGPSPAWNFRHAAERGEDTIELYEMSLGMMTAALTAGAWDVPFMPVPALPHTGYVEEDWPRGRRSRATTDLGTADIVAALSPDVAFVHVDQADPQGNGAILGPLGEVLVAAQAASTVVLIAEEIVDTETVLSAGVSVPGLITSAVVHRPGAVAPDGVIGRYDRDVAAYEEYVTRAATSEGFSAWLEDIGASPVRDGERSQG
jgi:glutaconate CoA-transferase subunit A